MKNYQDKMSLRDSSKRSSVVASSKQISPEVDLSYLDEISKSDIYKSYSGRLVIKEIFLVSKAFVNGFPSWICVMISVINALIPFCFSLYQDLSYGDHEFNVRKY